MADEEVTADDFAEVETESDEPVREKGPVGVPHWQALKDIWRVLPCEVLPVNTTKWKTAVAVDKEDDQYVLTTDKGEKLYERDIHTPILVRTTEDDADLLR